MNRPIYERPILVRHRMGMMNKFSLAHSLQPQTQIDGVDVDALIEAYGSPLFVFSHKRLVARYRELRDAFARRHAKVRIAWSYKTNYLDSVCKVFHKEGAWAEVVSEFEFEKARHNGIPGERIHINGPLKTADMLRRVLPTGALIHIDNHDEIALLERIAVELDLRPRVLVRINMSVGSIPSWSRFGFNLDSGQAHSAVERIVAGGKLELIGVHCHLGTFIMDAGAYREQCTKLAVFTNEIRRDHGVRVELLDIGGGFASQNKLKAQYLPSEMASPSFDRYAEAVAEGLEALDVPTAERPTLVLETGRALVDEAGFLVSSVIATKRMPDGRRGLIIDAGVNTLFTSFWYDHEVVPAQPFSGSREPSVLFGPLCMNIDVVRDTLPFPALDIGDRVVFRNVGAYNVTQWMQFITYRPAVVMVGEGGQHALMRRREQLETILEREEVPPWL